MAKTYHRKEHVSARRAREESKKPQWTTKQYVRFWTGLGVGLLVVILFFSTVLPLLQGRTIMWFGSPVFTGKGGMVAKIDGAYYTVGSFEKPVGYAEDDALLIKRDKNQYEICLVPEDSASLIKYAYITVVPEKTAQDMRDMVSSYNSTAGDMYTYECNGLTFNYFASRIKSDDESVTDQELMVACYVQTSRNCLVLVNLNTDYMPEDQLPEADAMLAYLPELTRHLTVY